LPIIVGNGNKTRRSRDFNKQTSSSTTDSDEDFTETTTRRAWSDFCKGRSSQSEDETIEKKKKLGKTKKISAPKKAGKGRNKKPKLKRALKISGLDLLHSQTLFSTSDQAIGLRLPPAAGCIDEALTNYAGTMIHEELDVPSTSTEIPYSLKILLDVYKAQFMSFLESMKSSAFKENLHRQIETEKEKNKRLLNRTGQLEKQIKVLVEDSVVLLKARMQELGINTTSQNDLLCKAKEIVGKHKELQIMANKIQAQVSSLEDEHNSILANHVKKLAEKHSRQSIDFELASKDSHDLVLKEIENTFIHRKNLKHKITTLEAELAMIEKANEDKKESPAVNQDLLPVSKSLNNQQGIFISANIYKSASGPSQPSSKGSRKNREPRSKTHDWPEIPEIGKIDEKNPEILAQKILETGRQIEAGKLLAGFQVKPQPTKQEMAPSQKKSNLSNVHIPQTNVNSLMKNETLQMISQKALKTVNMSPVGGHPQVPKTGGGSLPTKRVGESHKVVNFEDRLKSIITSALQGQDQAQAPQQKQQSQQQNQHHHHHQHQPMMNQLTTSPKKVSQHQSNVCPPFNSHLQQSQMLTVSTTGLAPQQHSTISPTQISSLKNQKQIVVPLPQMAPHLPSDHSREHQILQQQQFQESSYVQLKRNEHMPNFAKVMNIMHHESSKMYQRHPQISQHQQQAQFMQRERENSVMLQQRAMMEDKREFKTPDNVRYERQDMGRSSVGSIENEYINSGSSGSSSNKSQTQRSSSSLSQPDYTQVSPAKLALRRHLSQEKISQHAVSTPFNSQLTTKTIGDFINSEIEKTLEITPQSIINAVIQHNMPSNNRMNSDSIIDCSINQERDIDHQIYHHHHPYATIKPATSKQQQQHIQSGQSYETFMDHRTKMLPISSKYISPSSNVRKSAIPTPPLRHEDSVSYMSITGKSPERHMHESSYKIDTKIFTSNIGISMRKEEIKEKIQTIEPEPHLEGLAASLRQHVIASMKIKEESETEPKFSNFPSMSYPHIIKKECKHKKSNYK
jgi:[histone H3]-lysine79 N-trimethyltransferase